MRPGASSAGVFALPCILLGFLSLGGSAIGTRGLRSRRSETCFGGSSSKMDSVAVGVLGQRMHARIAGGA